MTDGVAPPYKRKLIEVALPLEDINKEAAREKSIRHGHPATLHLWWARRPLAAARAVLFGQLVDDPSARPEMFPTGDDQKAERERLFGIIRALVRWENSRNEGVLAQARKEIWASCDGHPPPILDPFAGGGSIPLEAQRLGLEAHASDLNPVAVLINKALIEIPPKWAGRPPVHPQAEIRTQWRGAEGLAEDVRRYGQWIRSESEKRVGHLYPKVKLADGTTATVIAWLWARTVTCPNPACGGTMPLVRSFWLGKKKGKQRYICPIPDGKRARFEIGGPSGIPRDGTVGRNGAQCLLCGAAVPLSYIRAEGKAGRMSAQLMAIAAEGKRQRYYLPPNKAHEQVADVARPDEVPDAELPEQALGFRVQGYGMRTWADLFTSRQLVTLTTLADLVQDARSRILDDATPALGTGCATDYANAVSVYLSFALSKVADNLSLLCAWRPDVIKEGLNHVFARQALSMVWDFAEGNTFNPGPCEIFTACQWIAKAVGALPAEIAGAARQADAANTVYGRTLIATDPPYYDNVGYADLSDFFYVWLRRSLDHIFPQLTGTLLTPKSDELVADPFRRGGKEEAERFFEDGFRRVFSRIRSEAITDYPISVFYAFKQAETIAAGHASTGWETLLEGMIQSGWSVTGTWPMRTELGNRMRSLGSNALASSVVLACRPRPDAAGTVDRRGFLAALRSELPERLRELQQGNIAPVDLAQAAIGPGMAVFSSYRQVGEADGTPMRVRTALVLINQVLDEVLAEQEGDFDTDSRWCVKWFDEYEWEHKEYGRAETLATALNTSVAGLERAGVIKQPAGRVWLIKPENFSANYDPAADQRPTMWEAVLHLSKRLEEQGIDAAGELMAQLAHVVDLDAAKELAYLLYNISERRRRAASALRFNSLVTSWPDIVAASRASGVTAGSEQMTIADIDE